jgi:glycosyltransferase involved in cell wall biosynthesis
MTEQLPKISVISACCSDQYFHEPLARPDKDSSDRPTLRLVGAGSLLRWKKWDLLVRALQQLHESERERIEISIWGPVVQTDPDSLEYEVELRQQIQNHGLGDRILLRGTARAMSEALREADWFVLPSTNEPCSVALIEALAVGLPAVVSASGGNVDIVREGETGCFFEPGNAKDLANKLRAILNSKAAIWPPEKIRESVRHRSASAVGRKYDELYRLLTRR